jgi:hypothetical protein
VCLHSSKRIASDKEKFVMSKISIVPSTTLTGAVALALFAACGAPPDETFHEGGEVELDTEALTLAEHTAICQADPRVVAGLVPLDVCVGANIFFRETFNGNGRTCASCHRVERNFTIDPDFIATLPSNDPLFVAELNPALANLERPAQMRARSLILENVDGTQPGGPNVRFVLRTVPHNLSMGVSVTTPPGDPTPPNERTGWSGDGAPGQGRLADFTNGAIGQHFTRSLNRVPGVDFRVATENEGQRVALFMRELGRKNEVNLNAIGFSDAGANTGRQRFLAVGCNGCHNNAGANTGGGPNNVGNVNRNFATNVEAARNAALASFPRDGGFGSTPTNPDGSFGNQAFNSTPLIEAADTGPFFHTDTTVSGAPAFNASTADTIEQATAFYATPAFANRPGGDGQPLAINAADIENIGRFLRATNAVFNIQMAFKRLEGSRGVGNRFGNGQLAVQQRLLVLARVELDDAIAVLTSAPGGTINASQVSRLQSARTQIVAASTNGNLGQRMNQIGFAINQLDLADTGIAANMNFVIGSGTLMD